MWRANPKYSKAVIFRKITFDDDIKDDYGHPLELREDLPKIAELYPYSDAIKRQTIGITDEKAYQLITTPFEVSAQDQFIIEGGKYRIVSISQYEPMQFVIADMREVDK